MKKKRIWITGALIMGMLLTGCGDLPDISEHQSDLIAEYAGGVLLKYSPKYQLRLVENDLDEDGVEDSNSATGSAAE
ncbi:MAG: hypothetical protein J6P16_05675, partial [Eubacterium sp.]|nr:hypothetical protein [Eubacterium sp.]